MKKIVAIISLLLVCITLTACNKVSESSENSKGAESSATFENLKLVRPGMLDRVVFHELEPLEEFSEIAVVGKFIGDAEQNITYEYSPYFEKDIVTNVVSYNTIEVTRVLYGDVNVGDNLKIGQSYGVVDGQLISFSELTPMQMGDEWVFFLRYEPEIENSYWCCGDSDGRYPVPSAENAPMPLSDSPDLGVYNEENFKRDIYNEIVEKYGI